MEDRLMTFYQKQDEILVWSGGSWLCICWREHARTPVDNSHSCCAPQRTWSHTHLIDGINTGCGKSLWVSPLTQNGNAVEMQSPKRAEIVNLGGAKGNRINVKLCSWSCPCCLISWFLNTIFIQTLVFHCIESFHNVPILSVYMKYLRNTY